MKISVLLPFKENFSPSYAGAVSLFVNDTTKISKYKNKTYVYGNTNYKETFALNYINILPKTNFFKAKTKNMLMSLLKKRKTYNQI